MKTVQDFCRVAAPVSLIFMGVVFLGYSGFYGF